MYRFVILDPRPIPAATEANEKIFTSGPVLGVEVTVPTLAARCTLGNIDPQHTGGNADRAAIEEALTAELPPDGAILATVRADLDAVGAMAIIAIRDCQELQYGSAEWSYLSRQEENDRITMVATSDKFARGGYPGPRPLPTREQPWQDETASAESSRPLAAIAAAIMDHKVSLADRVATMEKWLLTGEEPKQYRDSVERERLDMITALETGQIKATLHPQYDGAWVCQGHGYRNYCHWCKEEEFAPRPRIAVVESTHRAATSMGYTLAPVVVALNPAFRLGGGEAHRKFTVCTFEAKFADIKSALAALAELEPGWGGSPTIGGSPQGVSSTLTIDQVVEVVAKHLR